MIFFTTENIYFHVEQRLLAETQPGVCQGQGRFRRQGKFLVRDCSGDRLNRLTGHKNWTGLDIYLLVKPWLKNSAIYAYFWAILGISGGSQETINS